jgi:hypothetical protein
MALAGLALLAASALSAPAEAMAISQPAALKGASEDLRVTEKVYCYGGGCGYGYYRRPYYGYGYHRPYYRPAYYGYRPYYRPYGYGYGYGHRPYYRSYGGCGYNGCGYGYRRAYWGGGYGYYRPYRPWGYGYYAPRPRYYVGPRVYWY